MTQTQVLSCEICKMFKDNYFVKHLRMAASESLWCNLVLPYAWFGGALLKKTCFIKTCSFLVLECSFQFNDNFLNEILVAVIAKCQILDPPLPLFPLYPLSPCNQANSDKLFPWSKTLLILHILYNWYVTGTN